MRAVGKLGRYYDSFGLAAAADGESARQGPALDAH
jgi:hypothetical protein